jgi:hypothetical protein
MTDRSNARTKDELVIEVWEQLDCESVGAKELEAIQRAVRDRFGAGAVESPAAIARTLADEGAVLRHPEVIECDARWRESGFQKSLLAESVNFDGLKEAAESIERFDRLRRELEQGSRHSDLARLRAAVQSIRKDRLQVARSKVIEERTRFEAREIAEWLNVWVNSPELFADWLDLRRRTAEFRARFSEDVLRTV